MLNIPILARSFLVFSPGWTRLATTPLNKNKQAEPEEQIIIVLYFSTYWKTHNELHLHDANLNETTKLINLKLQANFF
jgi:hypothetical protein